MEEKKKTNEQFENNEKNTTETTDAELNKEQLEQVSGAGRPPQHEPPL